MRVLVTGSRDWSDPGIINKALIQAYSWWTEIDPWGTEFVVVHGAARGADTMADEWACTQAATEPRIKPESHPADWERYGNAAGHKRNQEMLDTGIDLVLAFQWSEKSPGTKGCVRMAKRMGIPVKQFKPKLW
jgi:hypothetical protein